VDGTGAALARRIRQERERRGWSLADLALRSGVSRAMISKVERGEASPTAETLGRLATGFGGTLASLFGAPAAAPSPLARRSDQAEWRDPASGYVRRNVTPAGTGSPVEIVEVTFPPGGRVLFDNLADIGVDQHVWVIEGTLDLAVGGVDRRLGPGDCLHMRLDRPLVFENRSAAPVRYAVVLTRVAPPKEAS